jgi:Mrp family chromosome partitioning ATPase/DUF971 family protein
MSREQEVLDSMRGIIDPDLGKDIVSLGFIKALAVSEAGDVSFAVELTTPACPVKEHFKSSCERAVTSLPWVRSVRVSMTAQARQAAPQARATGLAGVANLIAVSSCKGGVGKSTVAVNLAYALAAAGGRVGLFDADVYGPSLPTMVRPAQTDLYQRRELIVPLEYEGVKLMSFGFVSTGDGEKGPAIMRGPMVSQVINQLLTSTDWGELDYLVIDMPPGTGDIQLTLAQLVPLTAAVIVTTPQELSFVDVVKGIQMFDKLNVDTVAVVENMSYFVCDRCDARHDLFGTGARRKLVELFGFRNTFEIPLVPEVSRCGDTGRPMMLAAPDSEVAEVYRALCAAVVREISTLQHAGAVRPSVSYEKDRGVIVNGPDGRQRIWTPADLRRACRCALCVEEMTGRPLLDPNRIPDDIHPLGINPMGNYAVAIAWSDGHASSIYPYTLLLAPS